MARQRFTSADTSINAGKLPRGYRYAGIPAGAADYAICCNVLNVIDDNEAVDDVIRAVVSACKVAAVFTVYEGNRTGTGRQTGRDSWQRNERRAAYVDRIRSAGYQVTRKGEFIVVTR